jgi:hypothetical protein
MNQLSFKLPFLIDSEVGEKFRKHMFIRKGGKAIGKGGHDLSRDILDAELICVSNEDEDNWIGNYAEGIGFFGVKFAKSDCRPATPEEIEEYTKNPDTFKF